MGVVNYEKTSRVRGVETITRREKYLVAIAETRAKGGRNLVLNSDVEVSTSNYMMAKYTISEDIDPNETYRITVWGELGEGKSAFGIYLENGR